MNNIKIYNGDLVYDSEVDFGRCGTAVGLSLIGLPLGSPRNRAWCLDRKVSIANLNL